MGRRSTLNGISWHTGRSAGSRGCGQGGVLFLEALQPEFVAYSKQVIANAAVLAKGMQEEGFRVVSGGTDTHLMLVDVFSKGVRGREAEQSLDRARITVNKNAIPFDVNPPLNPSGIRLGSTGGHHARLRRSGDARSGVTDRGGAERRELRNGHCRGTAASGSFNVALPALCLEDAGGPGRGVRVAIDARRIRDFGVGTYIRNLLQALAAAGTDHHYHLICSPEDAPQFADLPSNFETVVHARRDSSRLDHLALPRLIRKLRADVTHIPFHRVPLFLDKPYAVTIHDLSSLFYDDAWATLHDIRRFRLHCV